MNKEKEIQQKYINQEKYLRKMLQDNTFLLDKYQKDMKILTKYIKKDLNMCKEKDPTVFNKVDFDKILEEIGEQKTTIKSDLKKFLNCYKSLKEDFSDIINEEFNVGGVETLFKDNSVMKLYLTELRNLSLKIEQETSKLE